MTSFAWASLIRSDSASAEKPAEDDRVRGADAGARQHRDRQLGDHRHVDRDAIAGPDAELLQRVGRLADLALEVGVGDGPRVAGLADPVIGDLVAEAVATWRSMQLYAMLSLPPTNHLANGRSHSSVVWNCSTQSIRSRASRAQNASGSASASAYRSAVALACAVNAGSGGNVRVLARAGSRSRREASVGSALTEHTSASQRLAAHSSHATRVADPGPVPGRTSLKRSLARAVRSSLRRVRRSAGSRLEDDPLRSGDLDAVRLERGEQALAELAGGGPLLRRADRAQDLERDAVLAERLDPLDPRRLEDAPLPDRVARPSPGRRRRPPRSPGRCRSRRRPSRPG